MAVVTKTEALGIIRPTYVSEVAESLKAQLPDRIDLDDAADVTLLFQLGLSRDRLFSALGGEL